VLIYHAILTHSRVLLEHSAVNEAAIY